MTEFLGGAGEGTPSRRTLFIMRHAEAEFGTDSDHARPLSVAGRAQATAVGRELLKSNRLPDLILCSSALRTQTTKDLLLAQWAEADIEIDVRVEELLYQARPRDVLGLLNQVHESVQTVLIIGHEPTVSMLTELLANSESDPAALHMAKVGFVTAGLASLRPETSWAEMTAKSANLAQIQPPPAN